MKKISLKNSELAKLAKVPTCDFPKYMTLFINLINSTAGSTRPKVVGQMTDLIKEYDGEDIDGWIKWYDERYPDTVEKAIDKAYEMYLKMKDAFNSINRNWIEKWIKDLIYYKTYYGLKCQEAILETVAKKYGKSWKTSTKEEEAKGIDGYIGSQPVQIKSSTYKTEQRLPENITIPIIYYNKGKDGITIVYDETLFVGE